MNTATFTQQDIINAQTSAKIDILAQEMKDFKDEMRDFKDEMRRQNEQSREDMREIRKSLSEMGSHVRNISYATIAAIGAMVVTVLMNLPK